VVLDGDDRVVGIITDGDLIKRVPPTERAGIIQLLTGRLSGEQTASYELANRTAAQVMTQPVITVSPETSLVEALQLLLDNRIKRLPVVNGTGQLVGLIGRGGVLQALGRPTE
jgi:CBS domain-containing protein